MTITAKIIADSISLDDIRITTMELEYVRFIHSEFMTHRVFSRNAASSRAIPIPKVNESIANDIAMPVHWGKNQAGMTAKEEVSTDMKQAAIETWQAAANSAVSYAQTLACEGIHKQITNRITEPFSHIKVVVTSTEWDNFFQLRMHEDAQPEIHELAVQMYNAMQASTPKLLFVEDWHLPYVDSYTDLELAKMISASCCAQVSYRKSDTSGEKAKDIYNRLISSTPRHASPVEHQATPIGSRTWEPGVTHMDKDDNFWSNNFRGWIQNRALI